MGKDSRKEEREEEKGCVSFVIQRERMRESTSELSGTD